MLSKVALLFLLAMAVIALVGRWVFPETHRRLTNLRKAGRPKSCPECGRPIIGTGKCECRRRSRG